MPVPTARPEILGTFGAVTSTNWLASATGMAALEKGGNAFDAAVAAGLAFQVVEPHLNGPGGEVVVVLRSATERRAQVICGQGTAPARATVGHYRALGLDLVPGTGLLAAVVPGAFDAWMLLLRDHGTARLRDVLGPALALAGGGFPVLEGMSAAVAAVAGLFREEWTTSAALYLPGGQAPRPGSLFRNAPLAATLARLLAEGEAAGWDREAQIEAARAAFYRGFVAEAVGRFCAGTEAVDTSGRRHRGVLTADDLAGWRATPEDPVTFPYHGWTVCKAGPWGQGPVFLQWLALLEGFDLAGTDPVGPDFVHIVAECGKLAFADREAFYGDPHFIEVPLKVLLGRAYSDGRRGLVDGGAASRAPRPGPVLGPGGRAGHGADARPRNRPAGGPGCGGGSGRGGTVYLAAVDRHGNAVSATPSGGYLDESPAIPELGFALSTRAQMFRLAEDHPAGLAPGKRPRTTLSPTLALRDGGTSGLAFGTPGGDQQEQWSMALFLRHVHHAYGLQEAIEAPMFQIGGFWPGSFHPHAVAPGHLALEGRFPAATVEELRRRGHRVRMLGGRALGRQCAVARDGASGIVRAAATPRLPQAYAIGR
jgi:gamma-glutamyltranspeptidase/glutathione hydrolase